MFVKPYWNYILSNHIQNHILLLIKVSIKHVVASAHAQLLSLVITVGNTFPLLITVGKNNGSSFFQKKRGTSEMSSMGHRIKQVFFSFCFEETGNGKTENDKNYVLFFIFEHHYLAKTSLKTMHIPKVIPKENRKL